MNSHNSSKFCFQIFFFWCKERQTQLYVNAMPGFTLEDPYPLSAFKSTTLEAVGQRFCVDVLPVDASIPTGDASEIDGAAESNLAAVTVQGEAIKLYNVSSDYKNQYITKNFLLNCYLLRISFHF